MRTALALLAAGALCAGCGGADEPDPDTAARVVVREQHVEPEDGTRYIEGAVQQVELRRAGEDEPAWTGRVRDGAAEGLVEPGDYVLSSYTQSCSGNCDFLDEPSGRCEQRVKVRKRQRSAFTVITTVGVRCVLRRDDDRSVTVRKPVLRDVPILARRLLGDRRKVQIQYAHSSSERLLRVDVRETARAVGLRVVMHRRSKGMKFDKLLRCTTITLSEELGGRLLRSERTGRPIRSLGEAAADRTAGVERVACNMAATQVQAVQREVRTPTLSRVAAKGLPVAQGALPGDLCPSRSEGAGARRDAETAQQQLRALERAYRGRPNAVVRTSFLPSGGGVEHEDLMLLDLVATHLQAIPEVKQTGDAASRRCARRLDARLARLR